MEKIYRRTWEPALTVPPFSLTCLLLIIPQVLVKILLSLEALPKLHLPWIDWLLLLWAPWQPHTSCILALIILFFNLLFNGLFPWSDCQILKDGNNISLHDVPEGFWWCLLNESSFRAWGNRDQRSIVYGATSKVHLAKEVHPSDFGRS